MSGDVKRYEPNIQTKEVMARVAGIGCSTESLPLSPKQAQCLLEYMAAMGQNRDEALARVSEAERERDEARAVTDSLMVAEMAASSTLAAERAAREKAERELAEARSLLAVVRIGVHPDNTHGDWRLTFVNVPKGRLPNTFATPLLWNSIIRADAKNRRTFPDMETALTAARDALRAAGLLEVPR